MKNWHNHMMYLLNRNWNKRVTFQLVLLGLFISFNSGRRRGGGRRRRGGDAPLRDVFMILKRKFYFVMPKLPVAVHSTLAKGANCLYTSFGIAMVTTFRHRAQAKFRLFWPNSSRCSFLKQHCSYIHYHFGLVSDQFWLFFNFLRRLWNPRWRIEESELNDPITNKEHFIL